MTEILSIIFHIFFLTVISLLPNKIFFFTKNEDLYIPISIVLLSFALLLLSFLSIDLKIVKYFIWTIFFINLFFIFTEKKYLYLNNIKFFFFFLIVLVLSIDLSVNLKLGWDAQNYWIIKSLNFVNGDSVYNLKNLPRPEYPYFGSYLWAVFSSISFLGYEYFGRIFYIYLFCVSLFTICNLLEYKNNIKILSFFLLIIIFNNDFIFQGYQETLIFSYAIFVSYLVYEFRNSFADKKIITLILINFFLLFWIKNEAFIFSLIFIACILFYAPQNKIYLLIGLIFMLFFRLYLFKVFNFDLNFQSGNYEKIDTSYLNEIISVDKILTIIKYTIFASFKIPIIILVIISGILAFSLKKNFIYKIFTTNLFLGLLFFFLAYLSSAFPLKFHMLFSADRLLFQVVGFNIILIIILMNHFKIKKLF
tara:strand:- start:2812 stop:4074 length:1263 start_codon:yes stop_codon:yes gene_type:complete